MGKGVYFLLFLGILSFWGCRTVEKPPAALPETTPERAPMDDVENALRQGDSRGALDSLETYQKENPEDLDAKVLSAALLMSEGESLRARRLLEEVLKADSVHREALLNLALLEGFEGNRETQEGILLRLTELFPDDADVMASLGDFHASGNKKAAAREAYEKALMLDEDNITALSGLGTILLDEKKYSEAEDLFLKAVSLYPRDPYVFSDLSRSRIAQGRYEEARDNLDEAVELAPDDYWLRMDRAKLLLNQLLNAGAALEDLNRAIALDPDYFYAYIFRAGILEERGRFDEAIEDYRRLLDLRPDYYFGYGILANLYYLAEEWEEGRENYEKAYEYEPDWGFKLLSGLTYYRDQKPDAGKAYLQKFLDQIPREDHFYALVRMCVDPGYEVFTLRAIEGETDLFIKTRMYFYLGAIMQAQGGDLLAMDYYGRVRENNLLGLYERKLALGELKKLEEDKE